MEKFVRFPCQHRDLCAKVGTFSPVGAKLYMLLSRRCLPFWVSLSSAGVYVFYIQQNCREEHQIFKFCSPSDVDLKRPADASESTLAGENGYNVGSIAADQFPIPNAPSRCFLAVDGVVGGALPFEVDAASIREALWPTEYGCSEIILFELFPA